MSYDSGNAYPHRRYNPLSGEWVLVSPHRLNRPWQGQVEKAAENVLPAYDEHCYLCPGNERAGGQRNPRYSGTHVFRNDFAALLPEVPDQAIDAGGLLVSETVRGECRVLCFSPRHDLTLSMMDDTERLRVVDLWVEQASELGERWRWVQIFENRGEQMGASNPHPHGQAWALDALPGIALLEDENQRRYFASKGAPLLLDYARLEAKRGERIVEANEDWLVVVPYWAVWPYETLLLPRFQVTRIDELDRSNRESLAQIIGKLLIRYDNLFETPFPYSMGWHGAPYQEENVRHWQLHAHFYPPLLRSATIRKFMVGFEMLGEPQRDMTPEEAARRLTELPAEHYQRAR